MHKTGLARFAVVLIALVSLIALETAPAWARAGSGGSRGSRSYSAPARPSPMRPTQPTSPSRSLAPPASPVAPAPLQRPGLFGGLMGGIAGFALGGLLGSMLFGGFGHGFGGFGIGLMDILLIGGGLFLLVAFLRRRREPERQPAYAMAGGPSAGYAPPPDTSSWTPAAAAATVEAPASDADLERGLAHIRQMDAGFDPGTAVEFARSVFQEVQHRLPIRDMGPIRDWLTPQMSTDLQGQCDRLRSARRTNHVERVDLRRVEMTEAWQESGQDFLTIYFAGSMIDYTVDDGSGAVVEGSKTEAQTFEEYWTLARPVGPNAWKLSAIQAS